MLGATWLLSGALAVATVPPVGLDPEREPYLAVRTGLRCSACHVNRTGGGMRNDFGAIFGGSVLPMTSEGFRFQNRALNDWIKIGVDFRLTGTAVLSDATPQTALDINQGNLYLEARLIENKLAVYFDETVAPGGTRSREFFALLDALPLNGYAKAGQFFLPSGLRILDDEEFIREQTGFALLTPDQGVEVGIEPGPFSVFVSLTNGSLGGGENNSGKQVTGTAVWIQRRFRVGASASRNTNVGLHRDVLGGFGGLNVGRLSLLGEVDYIFDDAVMADQFVAFGEGDVLIRQGVNLKFTYGFHNRDVDVDEDERIRARIGLELFPIPYLQVSGFFTLRDDIPANLRQALPQKDQVSIELHLFF